MRVICLLPLFMPSALNPFHPCNSSLGLCCPTCPGCGTTETRRWSGRPWPLWEMSPDWAWLKYAGKVKDSSRAENHACNQGAIPVKTNGWFLCGWGLHGFPFFSLTSVHGIYLDGATSQHSDTSSVFLGCPRFTTACVGAPSLSTKGCCWWDFGLALVVKKPMSSLVFIDS